MKHIRSIAPLAAALILAGCVHAQNEVTVAGLYSAAHRVTVDGGKITTEDYLYIAPSGQMTAYVRRSGDTLHDDCFKLASGNAINANLQGRTLMPGTSPNGEPAYVVTSDADTFGLLQKLSPGGIEWFFHNNRTNSTAIIKGAQNVVNGSDGSYTITGTPLESPTLSELQRQMCQN